MDLQKIFQGFPDEIKGYLHSNCLAPGQSLPEVAYPEYILIRDQLKEMCDKDEVLENIAINYLNESWRI